MPPRSIRLPRRGNLLVTVTAVDENGFTMSYETVETPKGALVTALATMHAEGRREEQLRAEASAS